MIDRDLAALLRDERPTNPRQAVALFGSTWDEPFRFLFGPDHGAVAAPAGTRGSAAALIRGGAAQLTRLRAEQEKLLQQVGAAMLRSDPGATLALLPSRVDIDALTADLERVAAAITATLTIAAAAESIPVEALFEGVFPAPARVIGVPGVHPYQGRINRYYDLASPSTIPAPTLVAARRHFGQALALIDHGIERRRQSRALFPFVELLPFAERCAECGARPVETGSDGAALCGICRARLSAGQGPARPLNGLIYYQIPTASALFYTARTPGAYQRFAAALRGAITRAVDDCAAAHPSVERLFIGSEAGVLAINAADALGALRKFESRFVTLARDLGPPAPTPVLGLALGVDSPAALFQCAYQAAQVALRRQNAGRIAVHIRAGTAPETVQYNPATLDLLADSAARIAGLTLPPDLFSDLSGQIARGTAPLYYSYARLRLDGPAMRILDSMEADWGKESLPFFHALDHALALRQLVATGGAP